MNWITVTSLFQWINDTVLVHLVREIDSVNGQLRRMGCPELQIGGNHLFCQRYLVVKVSIVSHFCCLVSWRGQHQQSQTSCCGQSFCNPHPQCYRTVPRRHPKPGVSHGENQGWAEYTTGIRHNSYLDVPWSYIMNRDDATVCSFVSLAELAHSGCMSSFRWNGGGDLKTRKWDTDLPTDSAVCLFAALWWHITNALQFRANHYKYHWCISFILHWHKHFDKHRSWCMCCVHTWTPGSLRILNIPTEKPLRLSILYRHQINQVCIDNVLQYQCYFSIIEILL